MPALIPYILVAAAILVPQFHAQYSGSNFFTCYDTQLPNGTYTQPRCCVSYYESTDGLYTGVDCVGGLVSEDSSIYYCANGHPSDPAIAGAVNPACCGSSAWVIKGDVPVSVVLTNSDQPRENEISAFKGWKLVLDSATWYLKWHITLAA
ncbi:hypothetical protein BJ170DRAFT_593763 [Xylariales sp. AK1849]|nr:hypothetical protein BJ170DRAFT_593763 [Xylariales sp. AK1849]